VPTRARSARQVQRLRIHVGSLWALLAGSVREPPTHVVDRLIAGHADRGRQPASCSRCCRASDRRRGDPAGSRSPRSGSRPRTRSAPRRRGRGRNHPGQGARATFGSTCIPASHDAPSYAVAMTGNFASYRGGPPGAGSCCPAAGWHGSGSPTPGARTRRSLRRTRTSSTWPGSGAVEDGGTALRPRPGSPAAADPGAADQHLGADRRR
jgi:hypothetical protein